MNIETKTIKVGELEISTIRKNISNIHLGVYPPNGRIRVAMPLKTSDESVKLLIISKMTWIKKQQSKFSNQERQTKREYVSGESHYFFGNRYRLNVIVSKSKLKVEIKRKSHLDLYVKPNMSREMKEEVLSKFYRQELEKLIPKIVEKCSNLTGLSIKECRIKKK